jgi:hypothetical protein
MSPQKTKLPIVSWEPCVDGVAVFFRVAQRRLMVLSLATVTLPIIWILLPRFFLLHFLGL